MDTNFFAVSAMSLLTVVAAVPVAKVIHAGDTPASTVPTTSRGLAYSSRPRNRCYSHRRRARHSTPARADFERHVLTDIIDDPHIARGIHRIDPLAYDAA